MFGDFVKFGSILVLCGLNLAGCGEQLPIDIPAPAADLRDFPEVELDPNEPMILISVSKAQRCMTDGTDWDQFSGPSRFIFCDKGHTSEGGAVKFAQRDYYVIVGSGGAWSYRYTVAVNCVWMANYIESSIGNDGYTAVCPA